MRSNRDNGKKFEMIPSDLNLTASCKAYINKCHCECRKYFILIIICWILEYTPTYKQRWPSVFVP